MKEITRTYGVEIETVLPGVNLPLQHAERVLSAGGLSARAESYNHTRRDYWKVVQDGSVSTGGFAGAEVVSPVLHGEEGLEQVLKATRLLSDVGFESNQSCGIHVHFGINGFGVGAANITDAQREAEIKHVATFLKNYAVFERALDMFQLPTRRANVAGYARSIALPRNGAYFSPEYVEELWDKLDRVVQDPTIRALSQFWGDIGYGRGSKVNPSPMWDSSHPHGTVEIRHLHGTMNGLKINHWIRMMNDLWIKSNALAVPDVIYVRKNKVLDHLFEFVEPDDDVIEYWREQCAILNNETVPCSRCGNYPDHCQCNRERCPVCGTRDPACTCCRACERMGGECICCSTCLLPPARCQCARCDNCGNTNCECLYCDRCDRHFHTDDFCHEGDCDINLDHCIDCHGEDDD